MPEEYVRVDDEYGTQSFGTWEGMEMWVPEMDIDPDFAVPFVPTFALDSHIAAGGDPLSVYISEGDRNEILQFSLDGTLVRVIRRTTDPLVVTDRFFVPYWVDRDMFLTIRRDEYGVERVEGYRIRRAE